MHEQHDSKVVGGSLQIAVEAIGEHDGRVASEHADVQLVRVHVSCDESCIVELAKQGTYRSDASLQRLAHSDVFFTCDERQNLAVEPLNANIINRTLSNAADNRPSAF